MASLCIASSHSFSPQTPTLTLKPPTSLRLVSSTTSSHLLCRRRLHHGFGGFVPRRPFTTPTLPPRRLSPLSSLPSEASSPAIHFEDLVEKDWSFLDPDPAAADQEEMAGKVRRIIAAAEIGEESRVMVSFGSSWFVDRLVEACKLCELLLVIHDSLFVLAVIKEQYDGVRCWQGPITEVPEKFFPFDVVLVCYFPGMGITVDELFRSLAKSCLPGARVVVSFDQGREVIENVHRQQYPDIATSDLPDKAILEKAAADHSFRLTEFVDDSSLYLAVLKFCGPAAVRE